MKETRCIQLNWLAFIGYSLMVAWVSLTPSTGGGLPLWDKAMHFTVYAIFALFGSPLCRGRRELYGMAASILAYSATLEVIQSFVGREMSAADLLANALGIGLAILLVRQRHSA